jgi:glycosyltransferase involved in cell wall biosynthesis
MTSQTIRVVHVIDHLGVGGAQQLLVEFSEHAPARGIRMSVAVLAAEPDTGLANALIERGCPVHVLAPRRGQVLLDRSLPRRLADLLQTERAGVMHAHLEYGTIIGVGAAGQARVPAVVTIHNAVLDFGRAGRLKQIAFDRALRRAAHVIACGERVAAVHQQRCGATPVIVAANPVPTRSPAPSDARLTVREELGIAADAIVIVSVGRMTEAKGALDLLEAFASSNAPDRGAHLVYVGTGPQSVEVERRAAALGIAGRVHLLGHRDDVTSVLAASDVFASAAHLEGLPLALLEAMHAGVAVAATDVGDVATVLGGGRGLVVQPRRTDALAVALGELLDDAPRRTQLAQAARTYLADTHDPGRWVDLHRTVYEQVSRVGRSLTEMRDGGMSA